MLPLDVHSHIEKLDAKIKAIDSTLSTMDGQCSFDDMNKMRNIVSNYIVIASAGLVETGLQSILKNFCEPKCSPQLQQYLKFNLERQTTMNCEKIETLLRRFDTSWADNFCDTIKDEQRVAIDSIKSLRDELAHGKHNGTGLNTVKGYYSHSKSALKILAEVIT